MEANYYYCPDYDRYVMEKDGVFYSIKNGKLSVDHFYKPIIIGEIWAYEISKEEFYAQIF